MSFTSFVPSLVLLFRFKNKFVRISAIMNEKHYLVLAYYHFVDLPNPREEVARHKEFFVGKDVTCRIYLSVQGINGQLSARLSDAQAYMEWMQSRPEFSNIVFKLHEHFEHAFPRITVKYRKKLVAIDADVDLSKRGEHVSPRRWKEMIECEKEKVLIDVRNDYEWKIGHFEGSELPPCKTFRDFVEYADKLKEKIDPAKTPVMMCCTGGIRCEIYSSILMQRGFEKVYQLEGGIINYGEKEGNKYWKGKLFVFDDRLGVPLSDENSSVIGTCHHCGNANDTYYNCANMDCNELFLCCPDCLPIHSGCCQESCKTAERVRPYHQIGHKPFRKWYHYT